MLDQLSLCHQDLYKDIMYSYGGKTRCKLESASRLTSDYTLDLHKKWMPRTSLCSSQNGKVVTQGEFSPNAKPR